MAPVDIDPVQTLSGDLVGFAMVMRDFTERNIAENTLKRSEEQFKLLAQGVTDYSLYMIDLGGWVSSWNLGAQRIKGYFADEIIGEHFYRFYTEEDRENGGPAKAPETAVREGRFEKETIRVRKNGTTFGPTWF